MRKLNAVLGVLMMAAMSPSWATAQHGGHNHGGASMPSRQAPAEKTGKLKGRLIDFSDHQLTVEHEQKGRTMSMDLALDPKTKMKGELKSGAAVVVNYREGPQGQIATSVEVKRDKK